MPRILATIAPALMALGCASHTIDPQAITAAGDLLDGTPTPGESFQHSLTSIDGEIIEVPDPGGDVVVLELIRSADW